MNVVDSRIASRPDASVVGDRSGSLPRAFPCLRGDPESPSAAVDAPPRFRYVLAILMQISKACLAILMFVGASSAFNAVPRPDIILITADDLGLQLGCYGDPPKATPALDRLAASGTRFVNAYVTASSCSPSRSSIFTGLYPHQNGQVGLAHRGFSMHPHIHTLPSLLRQAGYATAVLGKVHVEPRTRFAWDLQEGGMETGRRNGWEDGTRDVRRVQRSVWPQCVFGER